jgi:hypothetical protein
MSVVIHEPIPFKVHESKQFNGQKLESFKQFNGQKLESFKQFNGQKLESFKLHEPMSPVHE